MQMEIQLKAGVRQKSWRRVYMQTIDRLLCCPYLLIAPAVILCCCFSILPVLTALRNSFFNVDYVTGVDRFVGWDNYKSILTDEGFQKVLCNTVYFTIFSVFFGLALALAVAVFLNKNNAVYNFVQGIVFAPYIISYVSISVLWMFLMDPQFGILNFLLGLVGIEPLQWMLSPDTSLLSITIVAIWKGVGYNVMILLAGMQNVPKEVYEAARLGRSKPIKTFFTITLPMISPTLVFLVTTSVISSFSAFDIVKLMTEGGPQNSSNLIVHWIYQTGFLYFHVGQAMAGGVILLLFVGMISLLNYGVLNRRAHY